jgi:hypothetical protein
MNAVETIVYGNIRQAYIAAQISANRADSYSMVINGHRCFEVFVGNELRQVHQYINDHE